MMASNNVLLSSLPCPRVFHLHTVVAVHVSTAWLQNHGCLKIPCFKQPYIWLKQRTIINHRTVAASTVHGKTLQTLPHKVMLNISAHVQLQKRPSICILYCGNKCMYRRKCVSINDSETMRQKRKDYLLYKILLLYQVYIKSSYIQSCKGSELCQLRVKLLYPMFNSVRSSNVSKHGVSLRVDHLDTVTS